MQVLNRVHELDKQNFHPNTKSFKKTSLVITFLKSQDILHIFNGSSAGQVKYGKPCSSSTSSQWYHRIPELRSFTRRKPVQARSIRHLALEVVLSEVWMHGSSWLLKSSSQKGNLEPGRCTRTRGIPWEFCFVLMGSRMYIPADEP
jgi:hypothetical protein